MEANEKTLEDFIKQKLDIREMERKSFIKTIYNENISRKQLLKILEFALTIGTETEIKLLPSIAPYGQRLADILEDDRTLAIGTFVLASKKDEDIKNNFVEIDNNNIGEQL